MATMQWYSILRCRKKVSTHGASFRGFSDNHDAVLVFIALNKQDIAPMQDSLPSVSHCNSQIHRLGSDSHSYDAVQDGEQNADMEEAMMLSVASSNSDVSEEQWHFGAS